MPASESEAGIFLSEAKQNSKLTKTFRIHAVTKNQYSVWLPTLTLKDQKLPKSEEAGGMMKTHSYTLAGIQG